MRESALFHHLIAEEYSRERLAKIEEILESHGNQEILPIAHGLFTASPSQAVDPLPAIIYGRRFLADPTDQGSFTSKFTTSIAPSRRLPPTDNVLNFTS